MVELHRGERSQYVGSRQAEIVPLDDLQGRSALISLGGGRGGGAAAVILTVFYSKHKYKAGCSPTRYESFTIATCGLVQK